MFCSRRENRAGWLCYSLFTFQWKRNYCKDLTLAIAAYACKAEGQKTFPSHHFPSAAAQTKHLKCPQDPIMWTSLFLLTWTERYWRGLYSKCWHMPLQTHFLGRIGTSCRSVAPVPLSWLCNSPSPSLKEQFNRKQHFSSVILIFRQVFSQWTCLHFSKIYMCKSSFSHGSISPSWEICVSKFWKAQPALCELFCLNCQTAPLPASADPVRLIRRQCYVFLTHWKGRAGARLKFPRDSKHRHSWWFLYTYV